MLLLLLPEVCGCEGGGRSLQRWSSIKQIKTCKITATICKTWQPSLVIIPWLLLQARHHGKGKKKRTVAGSLEVTASCYADAPALGQDLKGSPVQKLLKRDPLTLGCPQPWGRAGQAGATQCGLGAQGRQQWAKVVRAMVVLGRAEVLEPRREMEQVLRVLHLQEGPGTTALAFCCSSARDLPVQFFCITFH